MSDSAASYMPSGRKLTMRTDPYFWTKQLLRVRWVIVLFVALPLSFVFDLGWRLRDWIYQRFYSAPQLHDERVKNISADVREWRRRNLNDDGKSRTGRRLCTARPSWMSISTRERAYKKKDNKVQLALYDVLELDAEARTVRCEPGVTMGQLTHFLLPKGWTLPVVPEMDDLTVGGLAAGYGIEASSHKYALFNDCIVAYELVMADGEVRVVTEDSDPDLFNCLPWSYGSLGLLVSVTLSIIPSQPYVRLQYEHVYSMEDMAELTSRAASAESPPDFVETLIFSERHAVVMNGWFAAAVPAGGRVNAIGHWWKPWFYTHVQQATGEEYIPLRHYYHRHTRSIFWEAELLLGFGNHWLFRHTLGWLMPPKVSFIRLTEGRAINRFYEQNHLIQDFLVPMDDLVDSLRHFDKLCNIYPIWICPHLTHRKPGLMRWPPAKEGEPEDAPVMYVDIGYYMAPGHVQRNEEWSGPLCVRAMESYLRDHHGTQATYAVSYQTREEFWKMFDPSLYTQLRRKLGAEEVFMDVYDKLARPGLYDLLAKASAGTSGPSDKKRD